MLRFTFVLASLTTLAMSIILSLLLYEAQIIYAHVNVQGMSLLSVSLLWVIVAGAALPTMLSCVFLWRGFTARRELVLV